MGKRKFERVLQVVAHSVSGYTFEMLWDGATASLAVRFDDGTVEVCKSLLIDIGGETVRIEPLPVEENSPIATGTVLLPSQPESYVDDEALSKAIATFIDSYWETDPITRTICASYVKLSWRYDSFGSIPYCRWHGDYGQGKSRGEQAVGVLCYRPTFVAGTVGPAPIFRLVSRYGGTLVIDEADNLNPEVTKVLLCGYKKGMPVVRCDGQDFEPRSYDVYGPKLLTTRKRFLDIALESRCFTIQSQQCTRSDIPITLPNIFWQEATHIRNQLLNYRFNHIGNEEVITYSNNGLEPRLQEIAAGLRTIIGDDTNTLHELDLRLMEHQSQLEQDGAVSLEGHIVRAIFALMENNLDLTMSNIAKEATCHLGYHLSAQRVGSNLRSLGLDLGNAQGKVVLKKTDANMTKLQHLRKRYEGQ